MSEAILYKRNTCPLDKNKIFKLDSQPAGFSLLEVLISIVIFVIAIAGLSTLFMSGKRLLLHAQYRTTAGELGRVFLNPLQMDVREDEWLNNCLSTGAGCPGSQTIGTIDYNPTYAINNVAGTDLRRVVLTVDWTEPAP